MLFASAINSAVGAAEEMNRLEMPSAVGHTGLVAGSLHRDAWQGRVRASIADEGRSLGLRRVSGAYSGHCHSLSSPTAEHSTSLMMRSMAATRRQSDA